MHLPKSPGADKGLRRSIRPENESQIRLAFMFSQADIIFRQVVLGRKVWTISLVYLLKLLKGGNISKAYISSEIRLAVTAISSRSEQGAEWSSRKFALTISCFDLVRLLLRWREEKQKKLFLYWKWNSPKLSEWKANSQGNVLGTESKQYKGFQWPLWCPKCWWKRSAVLQRISWNDPLREVYFVRERLFFLLALWTNAKACNTMYSFLIRVDRRMVLQEIIVLLPDWETVISISSQTISLLQLFGRNAPYLSARLYLVKRTAGNVTCPKLKAFWAPK